MIAKVRTVSLKRPPEHACQRIGLAGRRRPARMSLRTVIVGMGVAWEGGGWDFARFRGGPRRMCTFRVATFFWLPGGTCSGPGCVGMGNRKEAVMSDRRRNFLKSGIMLFR